MASEERCRGHPRSPRTGRLPSVSVCPGMTGHAHIPPRRWAEPLAPALLLLFQIRELVPESQAYMDLLAFERKLDQTIMRKRVDIQEALKRPMKVPQFGGGKRVLRPGPRRDKRGGPGCGHPRFTLGDTLHFLSKSGSCVFISPILLTLRSPMLRILMAASPPGSCGWKGSSWMTYVPAQVSPGVLGWAWGWAEGRARCLH